MKRLTYFATHITMLLIQGLTLSCLTGCSKSESTEFIIDDFAGRYEIVSITSGQPLDLNNDGIASNDLYSEYSATFHYENAPYLPEPFDFTDSYNYADFKFKKADFRFPCQHFNDYPNAPVPLRAYNWGFRIMEYQLTNSGEVIITSNVFPDDKTAEEHMGYVRSLTRFNKNLFQVDMTLKIYDFKQLKWVITPVSVVYERRVIYKD